ncbi:MAG: c-type cytochrome [Planctomycetota bacterium]|nr:c-type cytochrome [Planctomycetota bacterium]
MKPLVLCATALLLCLAAGGFSILAEEASPEQPPKEAPKNSKYERPEPPEKYSKLEVPDLKDETRIAEGKKLFDAQCELCHGKAGDGDSPAGKALQPAVEDLSIAELQDAMSDAYIYWRIMEGGFALGYAGMTPFKDVLTRDQVWQVTAYVRSLKAEAEPELKILDSDEFEEVMDGFKDGWKNTRAQAKARDQAKTQAEIDKIVELAAKLPGYDGDVKDGENKGKKVREQEDFKKFVEDFQKATADYAAQVKAGDWEKADAAESKIGAGCKSCHDVYRKKQ